MIILDISQLLERPWYHFPKAIQDEFTYINAILEKCTH